MNNYIDFETVKDQVVGYSVSDGQLAIKLADGRWFDAVEYTNNTMAGVEEMARLMSDEFNLADPEWNRSESEIDKAMTQDYSETYAHAHATLIAYLLSKVWERDWHGVYDAANDLRVLEAKRGVK
ncbi:MAG: hypothetical protein ACJ8R9_10785 [Steroidobacteraceae bacterium]